MRYVQLFRILVCVLASLNSSSSFAQNDIGITLNVNPPYSTRFADYAEKPGKVLLLIRNNTNQQKSIYLVGNVTGDNGVAMRNDPSVKPALPVILQPFQVYTANNNNLQELFSVAKYKITGISLAQIAASNSLPEGNYNICIRAYDYNTGQPLSADAPIGCKMIPMMDLDPPILIKPMPDEEVKGLDQQNVIFSWTIPANAEPGIQYKLRIVEMPDPKKNVNDAFNSGIPAFFETTTSTNIFVYGPAHPKLISGKKYAWAVTAVPGPKKIAYKNNGVSEVRGFTYTKTEPPKPSGPAITLISPNDKQSFPPMGGTNNLIGLKWDYTNLDKKVFYEDVLIYEVKQGQTPADAVKKNERVNSTKEPYKSAGFSGGALDGKTYAWVVTLNDAGKIYTSDIRTFTIEASKAAGQTFKTFDFAGYPIQVNSLTDKGGYNYKGSGSTQLYKDGPSVTIWFDNISIKPFSKKSDKEYTDWRATSGSVKSKQFKQNIYYSLPNDIDGDLKFQADFLELKAAMSTDIKPDGTFSMKEKYGENGAKIYGTFTWETYFLYKAENGEEKTAVYTDKVTAAFDYNKKFDDSETFYLLLQTPNGYNTMELASNSFKGTLKLVPALHIVGGKTPKFSFDGYYEIPQLKNGKPGITVNFSKKESMSFTTNVNYSIPVTKDNSVTASFDKVELGLGVSCTIKVPSLALKFTQNGKSYSFNFTKAFFNYSNGLYCKEKTLSKGDINISGFPVTFNQASISLIQSKLFELKISGEFDVPFIKQKAQVTFFATEEGIQEAGVDFDFDKLVTLYQNLEGDKCVLQPYSGIFKSDRIVMNGNLTFSNINNPEKNFNVPNVPTPDFYIKANGSVGIENGSWAGGKVPYQVAGSYNGFKFTPYEINLSKSGSNYRIAFNGMLVLADNLASDTKLPNYSANVTFSAAEIKGGGPPPSQEASFSSSDVQGGRHDAAVDFGMKFKYFNNNTEGKGFSAEGEFGIQQPDPMKVHAKMIIARAPQGFNYWFFEAGQENVVQIPTGVLDLGIYGFTGRVYYKMKHAGKNINASDYVLDGSKFIGIYGLTKLKTLTDNGVKFWGDVAFEVLTNSSGLESICFRGNGDLMSDGVGSGGMIHAHDCQLDFYWAPQKEVYGNFNVSVNFKEMVTADANVGFDITPDAIEIWGSAASASLFGLSGCGSADFGFHLTDENANLWGNFNLVKIHKGFDFWVCKPDVDVYAGLYFDAYVNYSPFQFKGNGNLSGHVHVAGCRLSGNIGLNLNAQIMFPKPTCVSAGIEIETPLKDFGFYAGIKNGSIIFDKCYN